MRGSGFFLLFFFLLLVVAGSEVLFAADFFRAKKKIMVGFLQTERETYPEELTFSYGISEALSELGATVVRMDYNSIVDFAKIKSRALSEANGDVASVGRIESELIKREVMAFLKVHDIDRIFIPGNFYNLDTEPYTPTPNRQLITAAITDIVHNNPNIRLIAVCGGLQGVMHAMGVKIIRVAKLIGSGGSANSHTISMPDPHGEDVGLHRMRVAPGSRLASVVSKHVKADADGWLSLFFPDAHGGVVSNMPENVKKLEALGYKIVGFADDGIIEALEDKHGNILFQDHPEALAVNFLKGRLVGKFTDGKGGLDGLSLNDADDGKRYLASLSAISIIEDFLHR